MAEYPKGASGQETDSQGIPWVEQLNKKEINRLRFQQWRQDQNPENHIPIIPNPFPPNQRILPPTDKPINLGEFFEQRRKRRK